MQEVPGADAVERAQTTTKIDIPGEAAAGAGKAAQAGGQTAQEETVEMTKVTVTAAVVEAEIEVPEGDGIEGMTTEATTTRVDEADSGPYRLSRWRRRRSTEGMSQDIKNGGMSSMRTSQPTIQSSRVSYCGSKGLDAGHSVLKISWIWLLT